MCLQFIEHARVNDRDKLFPLLHLQNTWPTLLYETVRFPNFTLKNYNLKAASSRPQKLEALEKGMD